MERLSVVCFAGTYALALGSELARFWLHAKGRWIWTVGLIALGLVVHSLYLANRGIQSHAVPITTFYESMLVLAWVLAAIALYLALHAPRNRPTIAGLGVLGLALVVLTIAGLWASRDGNRADWSNALTFWGGVHGLFLVSGAVFTSLAFVFGLMYMLQSYRLKRKQAATSSFALPSLEQSERWHRGAILLAFPTLTAGILTGLGLVMATRQSGTGLPWNDSKILATLALWVVFACLIHARYRPGWQVRRVMLLTFAAFGFMAFAMIGVGLIFPTKHGGLAALQTSRHAPVAPVEGGP